MGVSTHCPEDICCSLEWTVETLCDDNRQVGVERGKDPVEYLKLRIEL